MLAWAAAPWQQMAMTRNRAYPVYRETLGGRLLAAREAVMVPVRNILRGFGITEQQWRVLRTLSDRGALDPSNLAAAAMLRPPSLTRILSELVDRELIARTGDCNDGRRSIVEITPSGRTLVKRTLSQTVLWADRYAEAFGAERLQAFMADLDALTAMIRDVTAAEMKTDDVMPVKKTRRA